MEIGDANCIEPDSLILHSLNKKREMSGNACSCLTVFWVEHIHKPR